MKGGRNIGLLVIGALVVILLLWGCGSYNGLVSADQDVKKSWSNVETNYQRRTDLYSSVIKTVQASANFEKSTLQAVVEARAKAFQDFQTQIEGTENRINVARQDYNKSVEKLNNIVVRFPSSFFANMAGI